MRIKLVHGFKIRNTIDADFAVIGDHVIYPYIPKGEIWFDRAFIKEKNFFIKLFNTRRALTKKFGYEKAKEILRPKRKKIDSKNFKIKILKKINTLTVYLIKGDMVREILDPNFCFGGHGLVYNYIPEKEIWIDSATLSEERKYTLVHELHEFKLMKKGMTYNNAHDYALAAEKESRRRDGAYYLKD